MRNLTSYFASLAYCGNTNGWHKRSLNYGPSGQVQMEPTCNEMLQYVNYWVGILVLLFHKSSGMNTWSAKKASALSYEIRHWAVFSYRNSSNFWQRRSKYRRNVPASMSEVFVLTPYNKLGLYWDSTNSPWGIRLCLRSDGFFLHVFIQKESV